MVCVCVAQKYTLLMHNTNVIYSVKHRYDRSFDERS